jgi:RHS repeat-associated protein
VISDVKEPNATYDQFTADLKAYYNYYAFGMLQPNRHYTFAEEYKFGFNGKEMDNDWNGKTGAVYDYGFRIYDARIAKFMSVDPLTSSYPWYTPYQFAGNKPIAAIDLDGLEERIVIYDQAKSYWGPELLATGDIIDLSFGLIEHGPLGKTGTLTIVLKEKIWNQETRSYDRKASYTYTKLSDDGNSVETHTQEGVCSTTKEADSFIDQVQYTFYVMDSGGSSDGANRSQAGEKPPLAILVIAELNPLASIAMSIDRMVTGKNINGDEVSIANRTIGAAFSVITAIPGLGKFIGLSDEAMFIFGKVVDKATDDNVLKTEEETETQDENEKDTTGNN